jgi:Malectin domain
MPVSHQVVGADEVRLALQRILASEMFCRSSQLSRLLKYLCDSLLSHGADRIAEYAIGTEAMGRPPDFDPAEDAAVRVEMHRLRRRLREYYETEGASDTVRIVIPSGQYAPVVTRMGEEPEDHSTEPASAAEPVSISAIAAVPAAEPSARAATTRHLLAVRPILWMSIAGGIVLVTSAWLRWGLPLPAKASGPTGPATAAATIPAPPPPPLLGIRIGSGRRTPWTDRLGQVWDRDDYFEGGDAIEIPGRSYIAGAFDAHLYQSARTGTFSYRIPLAARNYEMRLYFIEPVFGPDNDQGGEGNRLFSLAINGQKVLDRFDILADADGPWTADVRAFKDISPGPDGYVRLDFQGIGGSAALLNAIEFLPARQHILNPIRLLAENNFYTDSAGNLWTPDNYSRGGRIAIHPGPVKNARDPEIFRHERFGRFQYALPVDRGNYSVYLYMSEEYWGPGNPGGGGVGTRVFSVFSNGTALLRSIDLFKEAGINYGVVRAFHHLKPNAQGKLMLSFEPEHDYASVYALEVLDEAGPDVPGYTATVSGTGGK